MLRVVHSPIVVLIESNEAIRRAQRVALFLEGYEVHDGAELADIRIPEAQDPAFVVVCAGACGGRVLDLFGHVAREYAQAIRVLTTKRVGVRIRDALATGRVHEVLVQPFAPEALPQRLRQVERRVFERKPVHRSGGVTGPALARIWPKHG